MSDIEFTVPKQGIGVISVNRPAKRNAFTTAMRNELTDLLRGNELDTLDAVILRGEGPAFSAGADLSEIGKNDSWPSRAAASQLLTAFHRAGPVVIAAVSGAALGLGSGLAMASDVVVAGESARFGYPEVEHGLVAALTMVDLKRLLGQRVAFELLVTGRRIPATEALELGMINEIVPDDQVDGRAMERARSIAEQPRTAVRAMKRFFYEIDDLSHSSAMQAGERVIELARKSKVDSAARTE